MKDVKVDRNFWNALDFLKRTKCPDKTWKQICEEAGVNYNSFRGAKSLQCHPLTKTGLAFANYFQVPLDFLLKGNDNSMVNRRKLVSDAIGSIDEQTFLLIERMLGMNPYPLKSDDE